VNSRERFKQAMAYGEIDRAPYFEEGIRPEVIAAWRRQGLPAGADLGQLYPSDPREEIAVDLEPRPEPSPWPSASADLPRFRKHLEPADPARFPADWQARLHEWRGDDTVRMLRIHRGFFLTMGVRGWPRFREVMDLLFDAPDVVRDIMTIQGSFAAEMAERVLQQTPVEAAIFSEPIGGNDRPLVSPRMYEDLVLPGYLPVLQVLRRNGVATLILRTFANARVLIPSFLKAGFNCLWACEVNIAAMDYRDLRREFGRDLRLIGGIDTDALRRGRAAIRREVAEKVPPLLADGGYVPLADGRVREDVPYDHYVYYRRLLAEVVGGMPDRPEG
jgi:uroporphyrinogen decarboxylase